MSEQTTVSDLASMLMAEPENSDQAESETTEGVGVEEHQHESDEVEADEQVDESTDEEQDSEDPEQDWHTIKVGGEEIQVTLEEALRGYQRDKDYRDKTMKLSEERKAFAEERNGFGQLVEQLNSFIKTQEESVDWESLRLEDPEKYIEERERLDNAKKAQEQANSELQAQYNKAIESNRDKLIEVMGGDDWTNEQRNADMQTAQEYLTGLGFTEQEVGGLLDYRLWRVVFDASKASKFEKTQAKVKEQVKNAPKSVKTGRRIPASERKMNEAKAKIQSARRPSDQIDGLADMIRNRGN